MTGLTVKGRYLSQQNGEPFFYLGDTAWELFHRLTREEAAYYLKTRAEQGFNVIQAVALAELEGTTVPNCYGRLPLLFTDGLPDPAKPDISGEYSYWAHMDYVIRLAEEMGLYIALLPTWGDKYNLCWGKGPVIFNEQNASIYGEWIASRYRHFSNIIWMLGGDRPLEEVHKKIILQMAKGIRSVDTEHLITFHPSGGHNSTECVLDNPYIDFHTAQTGHGIEQCYQSDTVLLDMAERTLLPVMDSESRYEDHPACFSDKIGYFWHAEDVRQNAYWNIMAGACGQTYGNSAVWCMNREITSYYPFRWQDTLHHSAAEQMRYLKQLRLSRNYFSLYPANKILCNNYPGMGHLAAAKGDGYAYVYTPLGLPVTVELDIFEGAESIRAGWFDPRTGEECVCAVLPPYGQTVLVPPTQGKGNDWVLVLDAVKK